MSDFASVIGGVPGDTVPVGNANPDDAFSYFWNTPNDLNLDMGAEDDVFDGSGGTAATTIFGGTGNDTILTNPSGGVVSGQDGNDRIQVGGQNNTGPAGPSTVAGGQGFDTIIGSGGNDFLDGGTGNDSILAGSGVDRVFGGDGADLLAGEAGNDSLYGGSGNDTLLGGLDNDMLSGSSGDDFLQGDAGNDTLFGGSGSDTFFFDSNFGVDVIRDFRVDGNDQILLSKNLGVTDVNQLAIGGGTDAGTGLPFTTVTIGADVIRIENMSQTTFEANLSSWVKIQP